jgi:FAD/FMN-containing dehydrogenase
VSHLPFDQLRNRLRCPLLTAADADYETSAEIWNRLYDRRPRAVVRCESASDVIAAVRFAREYDLEIAVKGGGHHAAGYASTDGGILLNLAGMRTVTVSPTQQRAVTQTGLTWAQFDQVGQAFGLACTGPIVSMTGVAGFTLGGGFGWLHRKLGLGCDNLRSAEVVTADGALVTANHAEHPDLFWALRGSGWNFGVITSMEFQIHPIGPMVVAGLMYFPLDQFSVLVERHRQLRNRFPDELTTWFVLRLAPPVPVIPKAWVGRPVVALALCHCGAVEEGMKWAEEFTRPSAPLASTAGVVEYCLWQKSLDARWGNGFYNDWRGQYFSELHPAALEILTDYVSRLESPWTDIKIAHLEGAVSRIPETATAYGNRGARFGLVIQTRWERNEESAVQIARAKELRDRLAPYATGGAYANFLAADELHRVPAAHGPENYHRLQELKSKYDPKNVFRANPNVPPAQRKPADAT